MALKDCTFFVEVNGKQVEMDYDQFRAYLLDGTNLSALAPTLAKKKGAKIGFETAETPTAKEETKAKKAKVETKKVPARTIERGKVQVVTASPAEAEKIEASVGKQKIDSSGFTSDQRKFLIDKTKEVYQEAQKPTVPERFVIQVPGDGKFTLWRPSDANNLHKRLTGEDIPGADRKDAVKSKSPNVKKAINLGARGEENVKLFTPQNPRFSPLKSGFFIDDTAKKPKKSKKTSTKPLEQPSSFESAFYSLAQHETQKDFKDVSSDKEFLTDEFVLMPSFAVKGEKAKKVKPANDAVKKPEPSKVRQVWTNGVNNATVPAEVAGVWQSSTSQGVALIETPQGLIALSPERLNFVVKMTDADGILLHKSEPALNPIVLTRNGQAVGMVMPYRYKTEEQAKADLEGVQDAIDEMKREGKSPTALSANLVKPGAETLKQTTIEAEKPPFNVPRPVTGADLQAVMGLNKSQAKAVMAVYKAMGLPLPMIRLAKGQDTTARELKQEVGKNTFLQKWKATRLMPVRMAVALLGENLPSHIQAVAEFMMQQRQRFLQAELGVRDIAKAYIITVSSIQARSHHIAGFEAKTGLKVPKEFLVYNAKGEPMIRPEDAVGYWLLTPQGKKALDSLEATGKVNQRLWKPLIDMRQVFGSNTLRQVLTTDPASTAGQYNLNQIREITDIIKRTKGNVKALDEAVRSFRGIAEAKSGFIQHLLGFGSTATVDAREINYWVTGQKDIGQLTTPASEMARAAKGAKGADYRAVTSRIQRQIDRVAAHYGLDPSVAAHVIHHWLWDATEGTETTHEGMMKAQRLAQDSQTTLNEIQGSIDFLNKTDSERLNGALAIIRGFSAANVTTPIHEGAHFYRRFMLNTENGFTAQEIKAAEDWAGARNGIWSVAAEEKWARGFERYLRSGEAPLPSLNKLFEKLAKWFQDIYKTVIGSEIDVEITPEIRRVFDRIFELQAEKVKATGGERTLEQRVEAETKATPVATAPDLEKAALKWAGVSRITPAHSPKAGQLLREFTGLMDKLRNKLLNASEDTWRTIPRTVFIASGFAFEQLQAELSGDVTPRKRAITKMYYADSQAAYIALSSTEGMRNNLAAKLQVNPQELHRLHDIYNVLGDYGRGASPEAKALGLADETTGNAQLHTLLTPPGQFTTGKPTLVTVYHGTSEEGIKGNKFAPSFAGALTDALSAKRGYFFAGSPITPWRYARTHMLMSNLTQFGRVFKFFVKLQNPLVYDMKGSHKRSRAYADLMAEAKNAGHDGVIITNTFDGGFMADTIVTVLHGHENQIKSAEPQVFTKEGKEIPLSERFSASHNILYQTKAESLGGDSTAKARAEAIRQNRERMQARREQARGDTSKQPAGGGNAQQQKGGTSASRQGRTRSKPQTLSDMLRIAEEQVQAAAEREPQTDTERRQVQAQRAVMALLRDYVRLKAQGNLPDSYTKADGTQVNREAELFDALTVMLNSATNPDDDARKATRKALSARFDEILPGRVKSKAGQPKTLQDMLREAQRNIRGTAGKKVLSPQEQAQERADQEIKYLIREYAQKMYAGRLADDLELPDGTTVSREQELLDALDALRDALKMPGEGLRLKARADAMRRVDFALLAPPLETRKQPLNIRNMLTGHAWGKYSIRSPLSYLNYLGSYERIAGTTGRDVSDIFNQVRTRFARGQYRDFNSALADLRIQLRPLKQQLIDEGYRGLPEVINAHVQRIEESSRNLGDLTVANVKKAWQNGDLNLAANLLSSILKAFVFNAKLRLNPKSIGLNYLQPLFTLYPYFTSEELVQLYNDSLNPDTRARVRDIAIAESGGRFTLEMRQGQTSRIPNPFTAASEQVRIMGHLAGEMLADRLKLSEGIERDMYIRSWAEKAEFDNSPWNAGPLFTGPIASVVLQFKPYMVKNLERFITDVKKNPVIGERISKKKQRITARQAKVLLVQAGIGGLSSLLTLAPPLRILAGPIMLGLLAKFIGGLADDEEVGERMAEAIYFGVPSAFALDLSSSVGFIEEPFGRSPADKFASALGPAVSMAYQGYTQADDIYELATRPQKVGESEAIKKELGERTWKLGKALTPYTRMVEAGYSLATGTRPEMFLDEKTPLTTGETIGRLFGLSPVRQASYYEMKEAPDFAKRLVGMQPDIAGIPRERGETDKTYRVKVQRVTEWRNSYGKQLENHPRFKTLDQATKDKALDIINGNISTEAAKQKPNVRNLRPEYIIRRAKESVRQAPKRAKRQMYVPPPRD